MSRKLFLVFILVFFGYVLSYFLNMDVILRLNEKTDKLNETYEFSLSQHYEKLSIRNEQISRKNLIRLAEEELGLELPVTFEDYAFFRFMKKMEGQRESPFFVLSHPQQKLLVPNHPASLSE
jgi:hypothetical protein